MMKRMTAALLMLLVAGVGVLAYQNVRLSRANWRLRDHVHAANLMITSTNKTDEALLRLAYTSHVLENAGRFGNGHPVFFGVAFKASDAELDAVDGNTMRLLDRRFEPRRAELENVIGIQYGHKLYRIENGNLVEAAK